MGKVAAAVVSGGGVSAISVGGMLILGRGSGEEQSQTVSKDLLFTSLQEFRAGKGGDCAKNFFGDKVDYESKGVGIDSSNSVGSDDLTSATPGTNDPQSCLIINWEKNKAEGASDNKGTGSFKGLGSFVNGDKGFVMFYTTKAPSSSTDKKLDIESGIYFLSRDDAGDKTGQIKKHKETNDNSKSLSKDSFDKSFPVNADSFDGLDTSYQTNGGFVSGKEELEHLCKEGDSDCPSSSSTKKTDFKRVGKGHPDATGGQSRPDKGNKQFQENLKYLFGNDGFNLPNAFDAFKGSWKQDSTAK